MKTLVKIIFILFLWSHQPQAQYYVSKDFERKGVTEYLFTYWGSVASYWTNIHKKEINLKVHQYNMTNPQQGYTLAVSFPSSSTQYYLRYTDDQLICTHPNGQTQIFKALPWLYKSKNFEQAGVTEYLQKTKDGKSYLYFTSKNKHRKIRLINVKKPGEKLSNFYKFPGGKTIYEFASQGVCLGGITCIHPDGRRQFFTLYNWRD